MSTKTGPPGSKRWPGIGLVLSLAVVGVLAGVQVGRYTVPRTDGLAGAAEVLAYGAFGSVLFIVSGLLLIRLLPRRTLVRTLWFVGPVALALIVWSGVRIAALREEQRRQIEHEQQQRRRLKTTPPAEPVIFASFVREVPATPRSGYSTGDIGMGMMAPRMQAGPWYLRNAPDLDDPMHRPSISDSVVFTMSEGRMEITSAPPWFAPAHMKLDYELLLLRVTALSANWVQVVVNETDGRTAWVERAQGEVKLWPEFILGVNTVEIREPGSNPIRLKPLDHAAILADGANILLRPLAVAGDRLLVDTHELADRMPPTGWVRWRGNGKLLVDYNLLC